jgi:transcriptional regulator with XRE-family HTH domain
METNPMGTPKKKTNDKVMRVVGGPYDSVAALVRDTGDAAFADHFETYQSDRVLVNGLTVLRCVKGLTQAELAKRMDCGQSKVSKMETSVDSDLSFGDIIAFSHALDREVQLTLTPSHANGADHIRYYTACIKRELDQLVELAGDDKSISEGVEALAIKTITRMVGAIEDSISALPHRATESRSRVCVDVEGEQGERLPLDHPKRVRKPAPKVPADV